MQYSLLNMLKGVEIFKQIMLGIRCLTFLHREALLAEMGVAMREDGGTVGVFSPKKVREY